MAKLNEGIATIEPGSAMEAMYNRLLAGLEQAAQDTLPDFTGPDFVKTSPSGIFALDKDGLPITFNHSVVDEDKINAVLKEHADISRKNAAYLFANATITSIGGGGSGGIGGSVSIKGDSMLGKLNALYGFSAGDNGINILDIYQTTGADQVTKTNIAKITGQLHLDPHGLFINGYNVISYDNDVLSFDAANMALNGNVTCSGTITLGNLIISKDGINYNGLDFYHSGNSNKFDIDWTMKNGNVHGILTVHGNSDFKSTVSALNGVLLGFNNKPILDISQDGVANLNADLNITAGGIKLNESYIIHAKNLNVISFSAANKIMNLGDDGTLKMTLQSGLYDDDGEYELISKFGAAYFPESFKAGHGLGNTLMTTYKVSQQDSGVVFHRYLRFVDTGGPGFSSDGDKITFEGPFRYMGDNNVQLSQVQHTSFGYKLSDSLYAPLNRASSSFVFNTDADFYVFDKPLEGKTSIGISGCKTRLLANELFFNDNIYWLALDDGVKYYGNAFFVNDIGSVNFSSGFAGSGWKIYNNKLTGNICATFDELTIRKKMRLYELEVQKASSTNGSLWISDSCSGDIVEEIL